MKYNLKKKYQISMRRLYATNSPSKEIINLLGINKQGFIDYINKNLIDGMTLDNFGKEWSLDHIVPVDLFDFDDAADLMLCYNYNNIMPMFINDNRLKGASVHFSLIKLNTMEKNDIVNCLIQKCEKAIEETYSKYIK